MYTNVYNSWRVMENVKLFSHVKCTKNPTLYALCEFTTHGMLFYIWYYMWHLPFLMWNIWRAYVLTTCCEFITKDPKFFTCERQFHVWIEFLSKCDVMQCVSSYNNTLEKYGNDLSLLRCYAYLHRSVRSVRTKVFLTMINCLGVVTHAVQTQESCIWPISGSCVCRVGGVMPTKHYCKIALRGS